MPKVEAPETAATATAAVAVVSGQEVSPASSDEAASDEAENDEQNELAGISPSRAEYAANASLADPNDYTVAPDGSIEIQATETLGHYADWLAVRTQRLRSLNGMGNSTPLVVGGRIKLDFSHVNKARFEAQRIAYHREMQEAFFIRYRVTSTTEHKLQAGESVWQVVQAYNNVPVWLLRQYNPDLDFSRVKPGMSIVVPTVQAVTRGASITRAETLSG
jgi:membrane-bound lytic murein transglycosylase D